MANLGSGNTYELRCNDAFYGLLVEALRLHSLRTRRLQSFRKLIELCLRDEIWRVIPFNVDDMRQLLQTVKTGPVVAYLSLGGTSVAALRIARTEFSSSLDMPLTNMGVLACILRLSLDIGGCEWATGR